MIKLRTINGKVRRITMKPIKVLMTHDEKKECRYWKIERECFGNEMGYTLTDHESYVRNFVGNWHNFVTFFHETAKNYGMTARLS